MSRTGITRVAVKPGDKLRSGKTEWTWLEAMTDDDILAAARSDADAEPLSPTRLAKMRRGSRCCVSALE